MNNKPIIVCQSTTPLISAKEVVNVASKVLGGGGGGTDRFAQGGGGDPEKIGLAIAVAELFVMVRLVEGYYERNE
jgi:alanyl-tRNA synthetase